MFGIAVAQLSGISDQEKERYQAIYCGLCFALKKRYGQISRAALSYDLAFLVMLYNSLFEPEEIQGRSHCLMHPAKTIPYTMTEFSDYAADLSIALAYHKCLDDVADDHSLAGRAAAKFLSRSYELARLRIPEQAHVIAEAMSAIRAMEAQHNVPPDATSIAFGEMLSFLIECVPDHVPCFWSEGLKKFGYWLGRFVLMMDAAVDYAHDKKKDSYNPFVSMYPEKPDAGQMREDLGFLIGMAAREFERLPCVMDDNLLFSVLYAGVWQKFNQEYEAKQK